MLPYKKEITMPKNEVLWVKKEGTDNEWICEECHFQCSQISVSEPTECYFDVIEGENQLLESVGLKSDDDEIIRVVKNALLN